MKAIIHLFLAAIFFCLAGCTKYEQQGNMNEAGIALTFDDCSVDNWYQYLSLLDSFHVKVTFYISNYHTLTPEQKEKLKEIQRHGHEIGYHTTNHYDLVDYMRFNGIDKTIQNEIYGDMSKMNRDGFYPTTFAYPYGAHNDYLDFRLKKIFRSVRVLNGSKDHSKSCTKTAYNSMLFALGMDDNGRSIPMLEKMIELAQKNHNCLVLVGHQINNPAVKFQVPYEKLRFILKKAQSLNMRFYTASDISN
jgi:hypothetical protein